MATVEFIGVDADGFEVRVSVSGEDFGEEFTAKLAETKNILTLMEIKPAGVVARATGAAPVQTGGAQAPSGNPDLTCQFCQQEVTGTQFNGKTFTAQQIASGRATKMGRMGKEAKPVCGRCWTRGGHAQAWENFYSANK